MAGSLVMAPGPALGDGGFETVSHHVDRGRGSVGVATEVAVRKPEAIRLKIRSVPNVRVRVRYIYDCRGGGERENDHGGLTTKSIEIELPLLVAQPTSCLIFAEADYDRPRSERRVKLVMRVRAISEAWES